MTILSKSSFPVALSSIQASVQSDYDHATKLVNDFPNDGSLDQFKQLKRVQQKWATKIDYLKQVENLLETIAPVIYGMKLTSSSLEKVTENSYSLQKFCAILTGIAKKNANCIDSVEVVLAYGLRFILKQENAFSKRALQRELPVVTELNKGRFVPHETDTQAGQLALLLSRMGALERVTVGKNIEYSANQENPVFKALQALYKMESE